MNEVANLIRDLCFRAAKIPPLNSWANRAYWIAASAIAESFSGFSEISKVSLVRGMVRGILPVLSDIDLHLEHDEPHGPLTIQLLLRLRHRHKLLKRIFPMLGEMGISYRSEQAIREEKSTIALLDSGRRLIYECGKWTPEIIPIRGPIRKLEQIGLFLKHFIYTARLPEQGAAPGSLARARIIRYLEKMKQLDESKETAATLDPQAGLPQLFTDCYLKLHRLAQAALKEPPWFRREVELRTLLPAHEALDVASAIFLERFVAREKIDALITPTPIPFVFSVQAPAATVLKIFEKYFHSISHSRRGWQTWGAVFLSHETARCLARSFPMFLQSHYWAWFSHARDNPYFSDTQEFLASSLKTLIRLQQPSQAGIFVSMKNPWAVSSLANLMSAAQTLTNHSPKFLPQTAHWRENIRPDSGTVEDLTLATAIDAVGQEIFEWSTTL